MTEAQKAKLRTLPSASGVYFHKNSSGDIIYVGKAAVLKNRVRQYFQNTVKDPKTRALVAEIADTDWMVTETEMDALFLESEMVKRYMPKWNILLRDDKNVTYVRIDMKSEVPTVTLTRNPLDDGAEYFGPYYGKYIIATALRILRKIFPYYDRPYTGKKTLNTDLGLTPAIEKLENQKQELSRRGGYPRAKAKPSTCRRDEVIPDFDARISTAKQEYKANLRKLISYIKGNRTKLIKDIEHDMKTAARAGDYEQAATLRNQYFGLRGLSTKIVFSDKEFLSISSDTALVQLQKLLHLPEPPKRIEGFDISHQSGTNVVASQVTFVNGVADRRLYRKFKIRTEQNNDFANMREVITRRLRHLSDWGKPDLILIDGGEPQLRAVAPILTPTGIPYIGLVEGIEMIIAPTSIGVKVGETNFSERMMSPPQNHNSSMLERVGSPACQVRSSENMTKCCDFDTARNHGSEKLVSPTFTPILLPKNSHIIKLLQRIRDESHRFAITYHTLLKSKHLLGKK